MRIFATDKAEIQKNIVLWTIMLQHIGEVKRNGYVSTQAHPQRFI